MFPIVRGFLIYATFVVAGGALAGSRAADVLFIAMDDLNWDSVGAYGCPIPGVSPHVNGALGCYNVDFKRETLPEVLRRKGYVAGVVNKPRDTSISDEYPKYWDYFRGLKGARAPRKPSRGYGEEQAAVPSQSMNFVRLQENV